MKRFSITAVTAVLGGLLLCSEADARFTRITVARGSALAKELGYTITPTPNPEHSGLEGTITIEVRAPRSPKLQNLSRVILLTRHEKRLTGQFPLELQKGKSGEVVCYFQLTPEMAKEGLLELVCPVPDMPNGDVYEIALSDYLKAP